MAAIGDRLEDIETPALLVDLDKFETNLRTMAERASSAGLRFRPHAKTHKSAAIARQQMALGAVGVCCQKVSEAEALAAGGVYDILISNEVVDAKKLERLARLAATARIGVCVDSAEGVRALADACTAARTRVDVLVEINVGADRCGVEPGKPALALAKAVASAAPLRFAGIQAYHGRAQHVRNFGERRAAIDAASDAAARTHDLLAKEGIECRTITGGGTGTHSFELASGVFTELQAGSYVFMDADYAKNLDESGRPRPDFLNSLFVYAQVMSMPGRRYAVLDAGLKALSFDSGMPEVAGNPALAYCRPSDEHGMLDLASAPAQLKIGDKVRLIPGHCDPTVALYDSIIAVRGDRVEAIWKVDARGAMT